MKLVRYADEPELRAIRFETLAKQTFPEYMHHNEPGARYWGRLYDEHPAFQLGLLDDGELVAEFHAGLADLGEASGNRIVKEAKSGARRKGGARRDRRSTSCKSDR